MSPRKKAKADGIAVASEARTRTYECTFLVPVTADAVKTAEEVSKSVTKYQGTVVSSEDWGKKDLAYMIKHEGKRHHEAVYTHMLIEMDASKAQQFEHDLYLNGAIMRHLVVIAEEAEAAQQADAPVESNETED